MRVAAALAAASLTLAAASVTACSAGSKSATDASASAAASVTSAGAAGAGTSSTAAAGNSGSSGTVKNFDVCAALTATQASQIVGTAFATTKSSNVDNQVFDCDYSTGDSALLQVSVATQAGKGLYDDQVSALSSVGGPPTLVKGVGDGAFFDTSPGASMVANYGAVFGDVYIKIGGLTPVTVDQGKQIVEELHAKL
jgi:hypothetical protein